MFRHAPSLIAALTLATVSLGAQTPSARKVAITIDDCPVVNEMTDLGNFQRITNGLIGSFQVERVPVTTFINERQLNVPGQRDARAAGVEQWLTAGFELGNHTYSHLSASNVSVDQFQDDVVKGEVITRAILEKRGLQLVWLRYPYLHSGATASHIRPLSTYRARNIACSSDCDSRLHFAAHTRGIASRNI